jgi:hypothetical protein
MVWNGKAINSGKLLLYSILVSCMIKAGWKQIKDSENR